MSLVLATAQTPIGPDPFPTLLIENEAWTTRVYQNPLPFFDLSGEDQEGFRGLGERRAHINRLLSSLPPADLVLEPGM